MVIDFLKVPETKAVKNRLHIDLRTTDLAPATEQALHLGATRADDATPAVAGNYCATRRGTSSAGWPPSGRRSGELCVQSGKDAA